MDAAAILAQFLDRPRVARVMRVLDIYGRAPGGLLANGLAFSSLFAAIPAALLVLGVGGFVAAGNPEARDRLAQALVEAFPPLTDLIDGAVAAMSKGAALTSIVGFVGVIWTVSQLYGAVDVAFARIFAEAPERDVVNRTVRGLLVVVLLGLAIVAFVVLVSLAGFLDALIPTTVPVAGATVAILRSIPFLIALAVCVVVVMYRTLPPTAPRWRSISIPAVTVGIVLVALSQVFSLLVPRLVGVAALAGSLASAFIALAWLSFTFQAILYGAAWVRARDERADATASATSAGSDGLGRSAATAEPRVGGQ